MNSAWYIQYHASLIESNVILQKYANINNSVSVVDYGAQGKYCIPPHLEVWITWPYTHTGLRCNQDIGLLGMWCARGRLSCVTVWHSWVLVTRAATSARNTLEDVTSLSVEITSEGCDIVVCGDQIRGLSQRFQGGITSEKNHIVVSGDLIREESHRCQWGTQQRNTTSLSVTITS